MANSVSNVMAGQPLSTGGLLWAPSGTALPTDTTTALNAAFLALGYLSDDGVEATPNRSTNTKKAWGGDTVLVLQTDFGVEVKFTLLETLNVNVANASFGTANVTATAANGTHGNQLAIKVNSLELDHASWVAELRNGIKKSRLVIPDGQPTAVDTIPFKSSDSVMFPVTLTCFPDASGNYAYIYSDDGLITV